MQYKNDQLAKIATHDMLTGLPNRLYLEQLLDNNLSKNEISQGCLLVIDLDKFKQVNDSFGHSAGDLLLKEVSSRIDKSLLEEQVLVRVGGDEFIIWAPELTVKAAQDLAKNLVTICDAPVMISNLAVNTGASIEVFFERSYC